MINWLKHTDDIYWFDQDITQKSEALKHKNAARSGDILSGTDT